MSMPVRLPKPNFAAQLCSGWPCLPLSRKILSPRLVEVRVAGALERLGEVDAAVEGRVPVVEALVVVGGAAACTAAVSLGCDEPLLDGRDRDERLERRGRRVAAGDRAVEQRVVRGLAAVARDARELPLELRLAVRDEPVRVERRDTRPARAPRRSSGRARRSRRRRRPSAAFERTPWASACSAARWVSRSIVEPHVAPGHGRLEVADRAGRLAERVHRDGVDAVDAAQEGVVAALDAALADHVAAVVVVEARILELLRADLGELPVDVRAERAVRVVAQRHLRHREARGRSPGSPAGTT